VGRRIQADRVVNRVAWAYLAIFAAVLAAFGIAAFVFVAQSDADALRPILALPEGRAAYHAALLRAGEAIAAAVAILLLVLAGASYALAFVSTRPLREARAREERFAADAAHELRTPLARIASVAQAARGRSDLADEALASVAASALEASQLVGDLLLLSRVAALPAAAREPVDIPALLRAALVARIDPAATVQVEIEAPGDAFALGDGRLLTRLFGNLLENAVRYARSRVVVSAALRGASITVAVSDDGPGVPADLREHVFERFVGDAAGGGSGLGLSLALWIARAHGGDLRLTGDSCFEVSLPAAPL
jgi:signal transduction histidine kinase